MAPDGASVSKTPKTDGGEPVMVLNLRYGQSIGGRIKPPPVSKEELDKSQQTAFIGVAGVGNLGAEAEAEGAQPGERRSLSGNPMSGGPRRVQH
ncbi:hypothetical protein SRHO_G00113700 [Serrasalmus rhombeus]